MRTDRVHLDERGRLLCFDSLADRFRREVFEGADLRRLALESEFFPACADLVVDLLGQQAARRELLDVLELLAGVDHALGAPGPVFGRVLARIQVGAPGLAQDVDGVGRA